MVSSLTLALVVATTATTTEGRAEPTPPELIDLDVTEKLGDELPLDLTVIDETGAEIPVRELFEPGKPVIFTFNYAKCPVLCGVQLGGLVEVLQDMRWSAGAQFKVITVSLDPTQKPETTASHKSTYLGRYDRPGTEDGWRFVTAKPDVIKHLADAVGISYGYYAPRNEYVHPAVLIIVTPSGRVASYIYGVKYESAAVNTALTNAALGESTESTERFILSCLHYEAPEGYARDAESIMRYAGIGFAALVALGLVLHRVRSS